jgi:ABC-type dipeptide/oligopeptide/nickel transport system permease component
MLKYIVRRTFWLIPVLLMVSLITFTAMKLVPGGPFTREKPLPPKIRANLEAKYHLDEPTWKQYLRYLWNLLHFDLGPSYKYYGRTINDVMFGGGWLKAPASVSAQLGLIAVLVAVGIGIPMGIISALKQNTWIDYIAMFISMLGVSIPNFVLGLLLIWIFAVKLGWLPVARWGSPSQVVLPAITLGTGGTAFIARLTRASMLEVIRQDYIRTARAKGLKERAVIVGHALKNSLIPVTTVLGPLMAAWMTGSFLVEHVFAIPGIGKFFITSVVDRDYTLIMGTIMFYAVFLAIMNILVDISYAFIDPRIRYE